MDDSSNEEMTLERRKQIFQEELEVLWERRLIPKTEYIRISRAYDRHFQRALYKQKRLDNEKKQAILKAGTILKSEAAEKKVQDNLGKDEESHQEGVQGIPIFDESIMNDKKVSDVPNEPVIVERPELVIASIPERKPANQQRVIKQEKPVQPIKPKRTPEQIRERNISVVLLTGVILLLFGGLILATSSWGNLNAVLKVFFIGMVSVVFAGMAFIAWKLKIKQTAFAFLTLAGLFIPITILSASYYQIFGEYLSLNGEGRALLGFLGGLLCFGIYFKIADYFKSKIFIIISILTFAVTCYFGFAFATPTIEWMFLTVSVLNLLLLWNIEQLKNRNKLVLFKPFIFQFILFKIIVETFVILTLFSSNLVYSITLIVISVLFLIFAVKFQKKYYEIAFSAIFTYGYIHFVYNSFFNEFMVIAFALVPIIFMALSTYMAKAKESKLSKNFMFTSLIESGIVFLYINAMVYQENYAQIFVALMILSAQFVYVSLQSKNTSFTYPAVVVFNLAFVYLCFAFQFSFTTVLNLIFVLQVFKYIGLYLYNRHSSYSLFKQSVLLISPMIMVGVLTSKLIEMDWLAVSAALVLISGLFFITYVKDDTKSMMETAVYGFPISFVLALVAFYPYLLEGSVWVSSNITVSLYLMGTALISIGAAYALKSRFPIFFPVFIYSGQILSFLAFILIPYSELNPMGVTGLITMATAINVWSVHVHRKHIFWLPVIITSASLYGSLYDVFDFNQVIFKIGFALFGPFIFFIVGEWLGKYSKNGRLYFLYSSHLANLVAIPVGCLLIVHTNSSPFLYVTQLLIYILSALRTKVKWEKYVFTYLGFSVLFLQVLLFLSNVEQIKLVTSICLMITAGIITILWAVSNKNWKDIMEYYLIPFIHLAVSVSIFETAIRDVPLNREIIWVGFVTVQIVFSWYLLMRRNWQNFVVVPLSLAFIFYAMFVNSLPLVMGIVVLFACAAVMVFASRSYFKGLIKQEGKMRFIDYYRVYGLLFLIDMNVEVFMNETKYQVLQVLVSLLITGYFILLRSFTGELNERKIYSNIAAIISLYPFLSIMNYVHTLSIVLGLIVLFICMLGMVMLSRRYFKVLIKKEETGATIDAFRIYGLLFLLAMNREVLVNETTYQLLQVFVSLLITGYFILMKSFTSNVKERDIYVWLAGILSLYPYWIIIKYADTLALPIGIAVLFGCTTIMVILSKRYFKGILTKSEIGLSMDFYRVYGLLFLFAMNIEVLMSGSVHFILEVFVALLIPAYFILMRSTTTDRMERKIYLAAAILLSLYPYWVIVNQFSIPAVLEVETEILPLFIVSTILLRKIFVKGKTTQYIEIGIVFLLFLVLIGDAMASNTLNDALIIGTISLSALLFGFMMKYKSYFIVGTGTILFNIYMNTNSMWSEMPWWLYLIIGGGVLIGIASFFEWKKQKDNRTSKEVLEKNKQRIKNWFNRWN
ncbi:hypothetical protein CN689_00545 [Peribacillus butanolivorans]|uniref:DUF2157 domain-containing protein n=1 Tax=Peribacillus butanolivorans TaxID=421767 RepID=A0AAX0RTF2_9BACI|nr:hypothetical protein [Peribacillus butanolivorans]PEJ38118.1 hypothetical protein CN689_00545 [Peribacillus butanolivorans]